MSNSLLISSDYKSIYLIGKRDEDRLFVDGNGILLSVLGNGITACELSSKLREHVNELVLSAKPFYELDITSAGKSHVSISYNEENTAIFVIGVTDIDLSLEAGEPEDIKAEKIKGKVVKLKDHTSRGLTSEKVVLLRTEISARGGESGARTSKFLRLYLLDTSERSNS